MEKVKQIDEESSSDTITIDMPDVDKKGNSQYIKPDGYLPFYKFTDLNVKYNFMGLMLIRLIEAIWFTKNSIYPDEYWQATEVAYNMLYGGVDLPWEWSSDNRIRNVLYPFYLSIPLRILDFLHLDYYYTVRASYYVAQWVLVCIGDYYFY
jgi:hypothetical protein